MVTPWATAQARFPSVAMASQTFALTTNGQREHDEMKSTLSALQWVSIYAADPFFWEDCFVLVLALQLSFQTVRN